MTPAAHALSSALVEETIEMVLDTRHAVTEVLAESLPFEDLDALLRELTTEILDTYHTVVIDQDEGVAS